MSAKTEVAHPLMNQTVIYPKYAYNRICLAKFQTHTSQQNVTDQAYLEKLCEGDIISPL